MPGLTDFLSDFLGNQSEPEGTVPTSGKQAWDNRSYIYPPNYAAKIRALDADVRSALVLPRRPFTFIVEFVYGDHINRDLLSANARGVTASVKSVEKPGFSYDVETLNAYNTPRTITKRVQTKDTTITFYDDATSYVTGMLAAYRAHVAYSGLVGDASTVTPQTNTTATGYFSRLPTSNLGTLAVPMNGDTSGLLGSEDEDGAPEASTASSLPSYGLRPLKKPFFEMIRIYDLGSEPASINVYTLIRPVIKEVNMPTLDYTDGGGQQEISVSFAHVGAITEVSIPLGQIDNARDLFKTHFDAEGDFIANGSGRGPTFESASTIGEMEGLLDRIQDPRQRTLLGNLLRAAQASVHNGQLNWRDLRRNVFEAAVAGTPIQNVRSAVRNIRGIEQAVREGRILDAANLLGDLDVLREGIPGLNSSSAVGNVITRIGEDTRNIIEGVENSLLNLGGEASSWLSRHTNPLPTRIRGNSLPSKDLIDGGG